MSDLLWQGLTLSLMGMSLTFLALGLLVLVMVLLERFTRPQAAIEEESAVTTDPATQIRSTLDEEVVAAIVVTLAHLRSAQVRPADLGATLEAGPGAWWTTGRSQVQAVNTARSARWRC